MNFCFSFQFEKKKRNERNLLAIQTNVSKTIRKETRPEFKKSNSVQTSRKLQNNARLGVRKVR